MAQDSIAIRTNAKGDASVKLTDGTNEVAVLTGTTKKLAVNLHDGTDELAINSSGAAHTDLTHIGGEAIGAAGSPNTKVLTVQGISGATPIPVTLQGSVGAEVMDNLVSASIAAQGNEVLSFKDITTGKTGKLTGISVSGEVPLKVEIQTTDGAATPVITTYATFFLEAGTPFFWKPPAEDYVTFAGGTGKKFRVKVTNNNPSGLANSGIAAAEAFWIEA